MDGFLNKLHSAIESALIETVAEALQEPEFKVYPEPAGLPLDITAEFRGYKTTIEDLQEKLTAAMGVPAEFILPPPSGKLYWLEYKFPELPFKLEFGRLRHLNLIKTNTGKVTS